MLTFQIDRMANRVHEGHHAMVMAGERYTRGRTMSKLLLAVSKTNNNAAREQTTDTSSGLVA